MKQIKRDKLKTILIIGMLCCLSVVLRIIPETYAAEYPDMYYSLHQNPWKPSNCQEGTVGCQSLIGYKNINNPDNPQAVIWQSTGECYLPTTLLQAIPGPISPQYAGRFRVYIPPGTIWIGFGVFTTRDDPLAIVARWEAPPSCDQCNTISTNYYNFPFTKENSFDFQTFQNDVYLQNAGGHIIIFSHGRGLSEGLSEGGWLYVKTVYAAGYTIGKIECTVLVKKDMFEPWYRSYTQQGLWDAQGDPQIDGNEIPVDTCTISNIVSENQCTSCGYYWCNNICQSQPCSTTNPTQDCTSAYNNGYNIGYNKAQSEFVVDSDKDGVIDGWDKCPNTQINTYIDNTGCPINNDLNVVNYPAFDFIENTLNIPYLYVGGFFYEVKLKLVQDQPLTYPISFQLNETGIRKVDSTIP
ncbi:MAG: hypothetical protein HQK77_00435 [Desulfobacterales bacterium]|nr:hypothetical protein [Desulfobacterales bacterium]